MLQERREIEAALHDGDLWAVAATNALELGVDVGSLDVTLHLGFPGVSPLFPPSTPPPSTPTPSSPTCIPCNPCSPALSLSPLSSTLEVVPCFSYRPLCPSSCPLPLQYRRRHHNSWNVYHLTQEGNGIVSWKEKHYRLFSICSTCRS